MHLAMMDVWSDLSLAGGGPRVEVVELTTFRPSSLHLTIDPAYRIPTPASLAMSASSSSTTPEAPPVPQKYNLRQLDVPRPDGMRALSRREEEALQRDAKNSALKACDDLVKGKHTYRLTVALVGPHT